VLVNFEGNKRRGNLPSLNNWQEVFNSYKNTSQQTQSGEIASWMQQRLAKSLFSTSSTKTRNDEVRCKRRKVRRLHKNTVMPCVGLCIA
jgi:hypothetical protein